MATAAPPSGLLGAESCALKDAGTLSGVTGVAGGFVDIVTLGAFVPFSTNVTSRCVFSRRKQVAAYLGARAGEPAANPG